MHLLGTVIVFSLVAAHFLLFGVLVAGMVHHTLHNHKLRNKLRTTVGLEPLAPPFDPWVIRFRETVQKAQYSLVFVGKLSRQAHSASKNISNGVLRALVKSAPMSNEHSLGPIRSK